MLLSFDDEQILMWRGKEWKPMYGYAPAVVSSRIDGVTNEMNSSERPGMHGILTHSLTLNWLIHVAGCLNKLPVLHL